MTELRTLRRRRLLTQKELAEKAGVSKATIVHLEAGTVRSWPTTLRKIAQALEVAPEELAYLLEERDQPAAGDGEP